VSPMDTTTANANASTNAPEALLAPCSACGATNRVRRDRLRDDPRCGRCKQPIFPHRPVEASDATFAREVEVSPLPVLVDFWAPWCGPCRLVAPVVEQLAAEHAGRLKVVKVNVDHSPALSARFGVQSIPTLAIFRGGKLVDQVRGALPKAALAARLAPYL
jgi:thioredoxin 2